jgi:NADH dehydrogenase FAD-containing subunit
VEPIRKLVGTEMHFLEAECVKIDPKAKSLVCKLPLSQNEGRTPAGGAVVPVVKKSGWGSKKAAPAPEETGVTVASSSRTVKDSARTRPTFNLDYDVLVMSIGCDNQDFNTPVRRRRPCLRRPLYVCFVCVLRAPHPLMIMSRASRSTHTS